MKDGWQNICLFLVLLIQKEKKKYIAAAFPSACDKTNLAMLTPTIPGWKVETVGDEIAWMKFGKDGRLYAINPENGFFGVAPGTSRATNPVAMDTIYKNTVFTNVASTSDGGVFWEGLEKEMDTSKVQITSWTGKPWDLKSSSEKSAHPNSRFCTPAAQCPILDAKWEDPKGVPIDAILFGGRRPEGVPLVYEARDWNHGVFIGASMRSEATAAAEFKGKMIMHDPFAMRPFVGYNMGDYFQHWANFGTKKNLKLPKVFHVNWFRKDAQGNFMWPGYGDNVRVLDWILKRVESSDPSTAVESPIGYLPTKAHFNLKGLENESSIDWDGMFHVPKSFWLKEVDEIRKYFDDNIGSDLPKEMKTELDKLEQKVKSV